MVERERGRGQEGGRVSIWQALKMAMQNFWLEAAKVLLRALLLEVAARRQSNALRLFYTFLVFSYFFLQQTPHVLSARGGAWEGGSWYNWTWCAGQLQAKFQLPAGGGRGKGANSNGGLSADVWVRAMCVCECVCVSVGFALCSCTGIWV